MNGLSGPAPEPLSSLQQRLWFLEQLEPMGTRYLLSLGLHLVGDLAVPALERALNVAVNRHDVLRARFTVVDSVPFWVAGSPVRLALRPEDLSELAESRQMAELDRRIQEETRHRFDITKGPLVRARLVRLRPRVHVLLVTTHHLVCDIRSATIVFDELAELYAAELKGHSPQLTAPVAWYRDHVTRQRDLMRGTAHDQHLAYWRHQLADAPPLLDLSTDRPRLGTRQDPAQQVEFGLDEEVTRRLIGLGQIAGATPPMTMLAAYVVLLARYSGQRDLVVGTPSPGVRPDDPQGLVGPLATILPLRCRLPIGGSFEELLGGVRDVWLDAMRHAVVPFENLVEERRPDRVLGRHPLFQVVFAMEPAGREPPRLPGLDVRWLPVRTSHSRFDLELSLRQFGDRIDGTFIFSADLFGSARIKEMATTLQVLLRQFSAEPTRPLRELTGVGERELHRLQRTWNDTAAPFSEEPIHRMIERQAARTPDAAAVVVFENRMLCYGELNRKANQLAHRLRALGAGPESVVAIHLDRSLELVVALLATLKSGAAFLLLDLDHPAQRRQSMLAEATPIVLLSRQNRVGDLPEIDAPIVCVDLGLVDLSPTADDDRDPVRGDNLAYTFYTSGTTGRPKGAQNVHRGLGNRIRWMQDAFQVGPEDVVVHKAPTSFDSCIWEILLPLTVGARVALARPGGHRDLTYLVDLIEQQRVTVADFVPTVLAMFLDVPDVSARCASLRVVLCGGEQMSHQLKQRCLKLLPRALLLNVYGPSETSIGMLSWTCRLDDETPIVPIGRPIANTQAYVCDEAGELLPVGVTGELYLGGAAIGRGYLAAPRTTAEKFVPDPFGDVPGRRLYRTGDLARLRPDGVVDFLGRLDRQVKLHGVRVELREIESVLTEHEAVRDAIVLLREGTDNQELVAYVCARPADVSSPDGQHALIERLRADVRRRLPSAMVPAAFVLVANLPAVSGGKLDHSALPDPVPPPSPRAEVPPRSRTELALVRVWERVLKAQSVNVTDDFFALGGDSMLAIRLLDEIDRHLGVRLPVRSVFEQPTPAAQATMISETHDCLPPSLVALRGGHPAPPLVCLPPADGHPFCYLDLARSLSDGQPVYGFEARGRRSGERPPDSLESIATDYLTQAGQIGAGGPWRLAGWSFGALVAYEMARQLVNAGQDVDLLALLDPLPTDTTEADDESSVLAKLLRHVGQMSGVDTAIDPDTLAIMTAAARRAEVLERMHRFHLLPADAGEEELARLMVIFANNRSAHRQYRPEPYHGRALLFTAGDPAARQSTRDMWSRLCLAGVRVTDLPGDHYSVLRRPAVQIVATALDRQARQAFPKH